MLTTDSHTPAKAAILLAHGAGAPMDSPFMNAFANHLAARGFMVCRFEFAYMAARRTGGPKRPPPRIEKILPEFMQAITDTRSIYPDLPLVIGGKSMGGRAASLIAAQAHGDNSTEDINGLLCLGYPFHAPGKPDKPRTAHLADITVPTLICQGTRDPFGGREFVEQAALPASIRIHWADDGNHDLEARKSHLKATGRTADANWRDAADEIKAYFAI